MPMTLAASVLSMFPSRFAPVTVTACALVAGGMTTAFAQTVVVDDFNDGTLDGWEVTQDEFVPWGGTNFSASTGALLMETNEIVPANIPLFTSAGIKKSDVETNDFYYHGTWRYELTLNNTESAFFQTVRGDTLGAAAVGVFIQQATAVVPGYLGIDVYRDGFQIATDFVIWDVLDNVTYEVEVKAIGDTYQMWVWPKGETRPDQPQTELTNSEPMFTPALTTFIFAFDEFYGRQASKVSATVDEIEFTPAYWIDDPGTFAWGEVAGVSVRGATPGATQYLIYSLTGEGTTPVPQLGVDAGVLNPTLAGSKPADSAGNAAFARRLPNRSGATPVWLQVLESGAASNVVMTQIN